MEPNLRDMLVVMLLSTLLALAALVAATQPVTGFRSRHAPLVCDAPASADE